MFVRRFRTPNPRTPNQEPNLNTNREWRTAKFELQVSVGHRVEDRVDPDGITPRRELVEVAWVFTLALPGVGDIGVVRHQHHDVAACVEDGAEMGLGAGRAA